MKIILFFIAFTVIISAQNIRQDQVRYLPDTLSNHRALIDEVVSDVSILDPQNSADTLASHNTRINAAIQRSLDSTLIHRNELNAHADTLNTRIKYSDSTSVYFTKFQGDTLAADIAALELSKTDTGITNITYSSLTALINAGTLEKGKQYRITDYATKHYYLNGNTTIDTATNTGNTEPLIVTAVNNNMLQREAFSETYPQDLIWYDWNPANWTADKSFGYSGTIIPGWKGVIYFRRDTKLNIETYYDWRNVKMRRWAFNPTAWSSGATYAQHDIVKGADNKIYHSLAGSNTNNAVTDTTKWGVLFDYAITGTFGTAVSHTSPTYVIRKYIYSEGVDSYHSFEVPTSTFTNHYTFSTPSQPVRNIKIGKSRGTASIINNFTFQCTNQLFNVTFGDYCENTTVATTDFFNVQIGYWSHTNIWIGGFMEDIFIEIGCLENTFFGDFYKNRAGVDLIRCHFLAGALNNDFGVQLMYSSFGRNFKWNTTGATTHSNVFGDNVQNNFFRAFNYRNIIGHGTEQCNIGSNFHNNILPASTTRLKVDDYLNVGTDANGLDLSASTLLGGNHNKTLSRSSSSSISFVIWYFDDEDIPIVKNALTEATLFSIENNSRLRIINQNLADTSSTTVFAGLGITNTGSSANITLSGAGTGETHSSIRLKTTDNTRGVGAYFHNLAGAGTTTFFGHPYLNASLFGLMRKPNTPTLATDAATWSSYYLFYWDSLANMTTKGNITINNANAVGSLDITGTTSGYTHSNITLRASGIERGTGTYSINTATGYTYYWGNLYGSAKKWGITRIPSVVAGTAIKAPDPAVAQVLFSSDTSGNFNFLNNLTIGLKSGGSSAPIDSIITSGDTLRIFNGTTYYNAYKPNTGEVIDSIATNTTLTANHSFVLVGTGADSVVVTLDSTLTNAEYWIKKTTTDANYLRIIVASGTQAKIFNNDFTTHYRTNSAGAVIHIKKKGIYWYLF